jgi:hypothetical protein
MVTLFPMRPPVELCVSIVNIVSACVAVTFLDMTAMMCTEAEELEIIGS